MSLATIISFSNHKGGTGKTTSTYNVGCALRDLGYNVLLIDLDPQANLTYSIGASNFSHTIKNWFTRDCNFEEIVCYKHGLAIVPMNSTESYDEAIFPNHVKDHALKELVHDLPFDYILLDCPPASGRLTKLALTASDYVIIPILLEVLSIQGLEQILNFITQIRLTTNSNLEVLGALAVCVNSSRKLTAEVLEYIQNHYKVNVFNNRVHNNVKAAEAPSFAQSVLDYAPDSVSAKDYRAVTKEILSVLENATTN